MRDPINYADLIPELRAWNNGAGIDVESWIASVGNYEQLIAYGKVLWPEFLEYDDCVFFADRFTKDNYRAFMDQTKQNKRAVETVMNHTHIIDICCNAQPRPNRDMILFVGRLLKDIWQAKLSRDFPKRRITVSFPEEHQDDLLQYEVSFFQEQ
jgi:hypothetical protein